MSYCTDKQEVQQCHGMDQGKKEQFPPSTERESQIERKSQTRQKLGYGYNDATSSKSSQANSATQKSG
jgi:hypothetical protein